MELNWWKMIRTVIFVALLFFPVPPGNLKDPSDEQFSRGPAILGQVWQKTFSQLLREGVNASKLCRLL